MYDPKQPMTDQINKRLKEVISTCKEPLLREVMAYAALGEGKRIRPKLLLASFSAVSEDASNRMSFSSKADKLEHDHFSGAIALDFACAIEMIHAYSLAHDDLPAMDNDDFRRGRPTCHKAYNEAMAILAGDGLLSLAVEVMAGHICCPTGVNINPAKALNCVIKASGVNGMVGGQVSDIINEGKPIDAETLAAIHRRKTGCLITASLEAGAILGGADEPAIHEMVKLGRVLGLAFQIRDDILDITSTSEKLGKPIGSDSKNQKSTYVTVHGMDAAKAEYQRLSREAHDIVDSIPVRTGVLSDLVSQTIIRTK